MPGWLVTAAAVLVALPFGWGVGVVAAYVIAGRDFGQLPAGTVPLGIIAAVLFALSPIARPVMRFAIMTIGTVAFLLLGVALT